MSEGTFNPSERRLCPDGSCIGLVGADGRCRVCGRASDGSAAVAQAPVMVDDHWDEASGDDADSLAAGAGTSSADGEGGGGFRPDRRLCDDGSCVGIIGAGDVCSVCGRPAGS
jgi:hypothetical protein